MATTNQSQDVTMNPKSRFALIAFIALSLVLPGVASADRYKHGHKHGHGQKYRPQGNWYLGNRVPGKHVTNYYRRDGGNEKLLIGLVVGGILGYAISSASHQKSDGTVVSHPWTQPAAYPVGGYQGGNTACLQEREYQVTVVVGGRNVPAYGMACLQPDGSWRQGPARLSIY